MRSRSEVARDHETKSEKTPIAGSLAHCASWSQGPGPRSEHSVRRPLTGIFSPKATGTRPDASF